MSDQLPQNYSSHTRLDPPYHFFLLPVIAITLTLSIWNLIQHPGFSAAWGVVVMIAVVILAFKTRVYALKAQDRVIRLEERLRLTTLLQEPFRSRIGELTEGQLVALRFAPDAEIPGLVERALQDRLPASEIKKAIVNWRPDYFRV
jgi:Family of unknown function (DUF6526)